MISVEQEWTGPIRSFLIRANWDCCASDKLRWIREMDNDDNWSASVIIDNDKKVVELRLERKNNELEFTAGKRIRMEQFEAFQELFYSSELQ